MPYHHTCYIRFTYDYIDLESRYIKIVAHFGYQQKKSIDPRNSLEQITIGTIEDPRKIRINSSSTRFQHQFKSKLNAILSDEYLAKEALVSMERAIKEKKERLYQDKNYVETNVDRATVWAKIKAFNMN